MPVAARQEEGRVNEKISVSAIKGINPTSPDSRYRAEDIGYLVAALTGNKLSSVLLTDIFNMLFLPAPQIKENYVKENKENRDYLETISNLLKQLDESGLRQQTVANVEASTAATVNIAINLIKALEDMAKQQGGQQNQQGQQQNQQGGQPQPSPQGGARPSGLGGFGGFNPYANRQQQSNGPSGNDRIDAAELLQKLVEQGASEQDLSSMLENLKKSFGQPRQSSGNVPKQAAQDAVNQTGKDGGNMDDLKQRMSEPGKGDGTLEFNQPDPLAKFLYKKTDIRALIKLLNGLPNASSDSKEKVSFKKGEYNGYGLGGDLSSIVPSAFAYPEELIYALYARKRLPKYDRDIRENEKTRYVLFDKSSSMDESKLRFAKTVAISLYVSAVKEKGDFYITYFDDKVHDRIELLKNTKRDRKEAMITMMNDVAISGGTDIEHAIIEACLDLAANKSRKKEIILITDGECLINEDLIRTYLAKAKAELITVYINPSYHTQYVVPLINVSKSLFLIEKADKGDLLKLISDPSMR